MTGIGLTDAQMQGVKATWGILEEDLKGHGIAMFAKLFRTMPEFQQMFRRIKNVAAADLEEAPGLRAHAVGFMKELSGMIETLENTDELVVMIENNARRHHKRKVTIEHYTTILGFFATYMKDTLGDKFTADASCGWQIVAKAITTTIDKEYKVIEAEKQ